MRLNRSSDYGLRLLMYLAENPDRLCTINEVASFHNLSKAHLVKIAHQLGVHGWVHTVRGKKGGIKLAKDSADIPLADIVAMLENDFALVECMGIENECNRYPQCHLHPILNDALALFMGHLANYSLQDLVPNQKEQVVAFHPQKVAT